MQFLARGAAYFLSYYQLTRRQTVLMLLFALVGDAIHYFLGCFAKPAVAGMVPATAGFLKRTK